MERPSSRTSYGRTASRSSTSTTNTRMTMHSANSSMSQVPSSPQASNPQHAHRFYHASCQRPATATPRMAARATPRLTREASSESTRQPAVSSFLQERLQKERQAESEKSSSWSRANIDVNSSGELGRSGHGSPTKGGELDVRRPQSTVESEAPRKKGLGVKDMEQVISSLHKQNFDLKLELYHRRERQTGLEDRVENLESEKLRVEEMNEHLVQEMEKRDKAVEEAVAMIVTLEAKLEQFAQERAMVQEIEAEEHYMAQTYNPCYEDPTRNAKLRDITRQQDDAKVITRMPSFLSDRSENTENLRNVYLGVRGSVLSLPQVPEGSGYQDGPTAGLGSPSLSVLSESSFVSVYGKQGHQTPQYVDEPLSLDGVEGLPAKAGGINRPKTSLAKSPIPSSRTGRSNSLSTNKHPQFESITNVIDQSSPLQQLERLDRTYSQKKADERPQTREKDGSNAFAGRAPKSPNHRRAREEKRESLRKVVTDSPGGVRLLDHGLPPTPDTISTSTLRRFRNSNDTLSKQPGLRRSHSALSDASDNEEIEDGFSGVRLERPMQARRATAKIIELNNSAYLESRGRSIQRPRSADETTVSHRRGNDWDTDSDATDVESLESSLDIWMRESAKPGRNGGRTSPDLFKFSSGVAKGSWAADGMFGPGNGTSGGTGTGIDPQRAMDLFPVQHELFSASLPPPPPNRRSSLNAQTAANSNASFLTRPVGNGKVAKPGRRNRQRRNSDDIQLRAELQTSVQQPQQSPPTADQKKSHYPPITGQQAVRNGLTKLFRRSLGGGSSNNVPPPTSAPESIDPEPANTEPATTEPSYTNGAMGVPSWVNRAGVMDDDRDSATPPPIMRKSRHGRHLSVDTSTADDSMMSQEAVMPRTPMASGPMNEFGSPEHYGESPRVASASGPRRKWLPGFGRAGGKNKTG
ncbi:hypothetical protein FZEAL_10355 [Fusarium zealandicum]|uniref:Centrosomin N-terminal motif 1 domain-containing protein n=1 Tax=Fusarium zealandicum TaxID=1053134 RepID=A0A8H4XB49_9HYPO|nr:hypothetical protein FZEAL_10355 [Fusarium zealandicum]